MTLQDAIGRQSSVGFSVIRDTTPPTLTLEAVVQSNVLVTWSATDSGSGVDTSTCLLEVREDDGAWQAFSTDCGGDDTYDGEPGHTYTFRLSASDNVSNAASIEVEAVVPYVTKYYYANGQRIAMQKEGVVYYVHSDHLGSTSLTTCGSQDGCDGTPYQGVVARQLYHPYGSPRWSQGTLPTDYTFTGQRDEAGLGLMHYGARFYSPRLGRFVSADTIVPQPGEPQALNRYSYVYNNPVIYTDPSGHCIPGVDCPGDLPEPDWRPSTDPCSMSQEEYIEYLLWGGVYFEREEAETGGTVGLSLSRDNLNFELGTALAKYAAQGGEASWQAAIGGDPFIVYAVAQFGSQLGEDAYLALGQAYQNRAAQSIGGRIGGAGQNLAGIKVYRVWGRDPNNPGMKRQSGPWGASWTPVDPHTVPNYREAAGLPSRGESGAYNAGRFVSVGIINDASGVQVRQALSVDGKTGGLTEFVVPNPQTQITLIGVYGVNPPY